MVRFVSGSAPRLFSSSRTVGSHSDLVSQYLAVLRVLRGLPGSRTKAVVLHSTRQRHSQIDRVERSRLYAIEGAF